MANDFSELRAMTYSGRGITLGMTPDGKPFVGYTLTARNKKNQRRILDYERGSIKIKPLPGEEEEDSLHFYPAIVFTGNRIVVGNGIQTELIANSVKSHKDNFSLFSILQSVMDRPSLREFNGQSIDITSYEPDSPNFTPRISAYIDSIGGAFHIARKSENSDGKETSLQYFPLSPGKAFTITTYQGGNESPPVSFKRELLEGRVSSSSVGKITDSLFDSINHVNLQDGENYAIASAVVMKTSIGFDFSFKNRF